MLTFTPAWAASNMASKLKSYHCEMLELTINFDSKHFKRKEFLADTKKSSKQTEFEYSFGSRTAHNPEHAHIFLGLRPEGESSSLLGITFHPGTNPFPDVREPYVDGLTAWLSSFFNEARLNVRFTAAFEFGKGYNSVLPIDYPLLINSKLFKGAEVGGYEIKFPKEAFVRRGIIARRDKALTVLLYAAFSVELASFDYQKAVFAFSLYAKDLVRKEETNDVKSGNKPRTIKSKVSDTALSGKSVSRRTRRTTKGS